MDGFCLAVGDMDPQVSDVTPEDGANKEDLQTVD